MKKVVRFIAQCIDTDSGDIMEESIMNEEVLRAQVLIISSIVVIFMV